MKITKGESFQSITMSSSINFAAIDCWNNAADPSCWDATPPDFPYNWNLYQEQQETMTMELPPYHRVPLLDER